MDKAFMATVEGRVQGVGFRYSCLNKARSLGIKGWVRNTEDGAVRVWAEGGDTDALLDWLHKGPPYARVYSVEVSAQAPSGAYKDFSVY